VQGIFGATRAVYFNRCEEIALMLRVGAGIVYAFQGKANDSGILTG
jgi:hypothetical protein